MIFCYLSLAQLSQIEEDIPQMFSSHYFNSLQLNSQEAASSLARIFSPDATDDPVYKPQVASFMRAVIAKREFLHQQYQETETLSLNKCWPLITKHAKRTGRNY